MVPVGCLVETPRTATAAGGTHPTGMHSCINSNVLLKGWFFLNFTHYFEKLHVKGLILGIKTVKVSVYLRLPFTFDQILALDNQKCPCSKLASAEHCNLFQLYWLGKQV